MRDRELEYADDRHSAPLARLSKRGVNVSLFSRDARGGIYVLDRRCRKPRPEQPIPYHSPPYWEVIVRGYGRDKLRHHAQGAYDLPKGCLCDAPSALDHTAEARRAERLRRERFAEVTYGSAMQSGWWPVGRHWEDDAPLKGLRLTIIYEMHCRIHPQSQFRIAENRRGTLPPNREVPYAATASRPSNCCGISVRRPEPPGGKTTLGYANLVLCSNKPIARAGSAGPVDEFRDMVRRARADRGHSRRCVHQTTKAIIEGLR